MQTFLPYPDFESSARVLDRQRLGKQRVEVLQILNALNGESRGWTSHPATRMWRGYVPALVCYGLAICAEWRARGYVDNCAGRIAAYAEPGVSPGSPCLARRPRIPRLPPIQPASQIPHPLCPIRLAGTPRPSLHLAERLTES